MKLSIYSLKRILFEGEAKSINCQTKAGEITVLDNHRPLISMLKQGIIKIIDKGDKEHYINTISGFLEVTPNNEARFIIKE